MPKDIHQRDRLRSSALPACCRAMGIIVLLGALAHFVLDSSVNCRTPASPDN